MSVCLCRVYISPMLLSDIVCMREPRVHGTSQIDVLNDYSKILKMEKRCEQRARARKKTAKESNNNDRTNERTNERMREEEEEKLEC